MQDVKYLNNENIYSGYNKSEGKNICLQFDTAKHDAIYPEVVLASIVIII